MSPTVIWLNWSRGALRVWPAQAALPAQDLLKIRVTVTQKMMKKVKEPYLIPNLLLERFLSLGYATHTVTHFTSPYMSWLVPEIPNSSSCLFPTPTVSQKESSVLWTKTAPVVWEQKQECFTKLVRSLCPWALFYKVSLTPSPRWCFPIMKRVSNEWGNFVNHLIFCLWLSGCSARAVTLQRCHRQHSGVGLGPPAHKWHQWYTALELLLQSFATSLVSPRCWGSVQEALDFGGSDLLQLPGGKRHGVPRLPKSELIHNSGRVSDMKKPKHTLESEKSAFCSSWECWRSC